MLRVIRLVLVASNDRKMDSKWLSRAAVSAHGQTLKPLRWRSQ